MDQFTHSTAAICKGGLPAPEVGPSESPAPPRAAPRAEAHANAANSDTPARASAGRAAATRQADRLRFAHSPAEDRAPHAPFAPPPSRARASGPQNPQPKATRNCAHGWTPERRASFLRLLAQDGCVSLAARAVGLSHQSAYSLRARDEDFALAWEAALALARPNLADTLWSRAIDGVVEETEREAADGTRTLVTRRRFDNRLATTLLARLDRDAASAHPAAARRAATLAGAWDELLDATEAGHPEAVIDPLVRPSRLKAAAEADIIDLGDLFEADDAAGRAGDWRVVEDAAGRGWTDLPPQPGWTGDTAPRAAILGADAAIAAPDAPAFRTLDEEEQALWDERRASRADLEAAQVTLRAREAADARAAWMARTGDLIITLQDAATLARAQAAEAPPNRHARRRAAKRASPRFKRKGPHAKAQRREGAEAEGSRK